MRAPIDIECPACKAASGKYCSEPLEAPAYRVTFHHAERVDAAARQRSRVTRHQELSDDEVRAIAPDNLRAAYRTLRDHHVAETTALVDRTERMRPIYDAALDWRRHVALVPVSPHTARLIETIDAAIVAEKARSTPMTIDERKCDIPARTLPPCDLEYGHEGERHANGGDGFHAQEYEEEHRRRQRVRSLEKAQR